MFLGELSFRFSWGLLMEYEKKFTLGDVANATLSVTIKKETIKDEYQKLLSKYVKEVALPGFRRGKVPAKVFEAKYSDVLKKDLVSELVESSTQEIFEKSPKEEAPIYCSPIVFKEMPPINFDEDFNFVISYDVPPILEIKKDEGFTIKTPVVKVTDEHIQMELKKVQERNAIYKSKDEALENGDVVTIDFKVMDGENEEYNRQDYVYTVGETQNPYNFDDDILGMKKGESKDIEKTYPDDYHLEHFRGKVKKIFVTVKDIKVKILPALDDELAQDVSAEFKTLDDLKKNIVEKINKDVELAIRKEKENILLEKLREENPIIAPQSLIMAEIKEELLQMFGRAGISDKYMEQYIEENKDALLKDMSDGAVKKIHNTFLLQELKAKYNFSILDEEFEKFLEKMADDMNMSLENIKNMCNDQNTKDSLMNMAQNDKIFDTIFKTCTFEDGDEVLSEKYLGLNEN